MPELKSFLFIFIIFYYFSYFELVKCKESDLTKCENSGATQNLCLTPECVNIASTFLNSIDFEKDPCQNFHQFACGKWIRENPIPEHRSSYGIPVVVQEKLDTHLRGLLTNPKINSTSKTVDYLQHVYQQCLKTDEIDALKSGPLQTLIQDLGGYPMIGTKVNDNIDITDMLITFNIKYGGGLLLNMGVTIDDDDPMNYVINIDQGPLGIGYGFRDYYLNDTAYGHYMEAYKTSMYKISREIANDMKLNISDTKINENVEAVLSYERQLAKITVKQEEMRNYTSMNNKWSLKELQHTFTVIDWVKYFKSVMPREVYQRIMENKMENLKIVVTHPEYMKELDALIKRTPKQVVRNFMVTDAITSHCKTADRRFSDILQELYEKLLGRQQKPPRWKECLSKAQELLDDFVGSIYAKNQFGHSGKLEATAMANNLKNAFKQILLESDWMDDETKSHALEKLVLMKINVGFDDFYLNDTLIDEKHRNLTMNKSMSFFETVRHLYAWSMREMWYLLLKTFDPIELRNNPAYVNAYAYLSKNMISFPAGILQPPFFHIGYPKYINYGCTGAIIGHEVTHGFDDEGRQFDKNGMLRNWWTKSTLEKFQEKAKCFINQYSSYDVPETNLKVNGVTTQGENIGDNGGVKQALLAYEMYLKTITGDEPALPGLNLTNHQIFFVSYAQFECQHLRKDALINKVLLDSHAPSEFRVNGVVSNMKEFSQAYKCSPHSPMNPDKKCSLW